VWWSNIHSLTTKNYLLKHIYNFKLVSNWRNECCSQHMAVLKLAGRCGIYHWISSTAVKTTGLVHWHRVELLNLLSVTHLTSPLRLWASLLNSEGDKPNGYMFFSNFISELSTLS
jgi:hypothetical protein